MPGIAGIIEKRGTLKGAACLDQMTISLIHNSSYNSGVYRNESSGLAIGWAGPKDAFADCLPIWNETRDICLFFYGEDFTGQPDLLALKSRGHAFDPLTASYLVHLYEESGPKVLERLNGWFSGVLLDLRQRKTFLFNDRFGIGRIYYHETENAFYFSSEAKSLLKVLPELRELNLASLGEFFSLGCTLQDRTLFKGISLLPPASIWTFVPGSSPAKETYFHREKWESQPKLTPEDYYDALKQTWEKLLPRYLRGNAKVALSLTGGVDSRMILAWAKAGDGNLPCYTFGGRYRDCEDVKISRQIAGICRQPHQVIPLGERFLAGFPDLAKKTVYLSDGTMDVTGTIDLYVQHEARAISPVRVTGTNGGEILRSLVAFKPMPLSQTLFANDFQPHFQAAGQTYLDELKGNRLSFTAFKQAPWYMNSKFVVERSEVTLRMPYFDNDLVSLVYQAPPEATETNDLSLRLIKAGNPKLANIGTDRGVKFSPVPGLAAARHFWKEFTFKAEYAYDYGMPQWLAKTDHAFAPLHFERLFLGRHKFHHFRLFYRDELAGFVKEMLLDHAACSRSYLQRKTVEKMVNGHVKGNRNHTLELHKLLTTELIHRTLLNHN